MAQKIIKIGSSAGITLSKEFLKRLRLRIGDRIEVTADEKNRRGAILPESTVDTDVVAWTDTFIKRYKKALDELADK